MIAFRSRSVFYRSTDLTFAVDRISFVVSKRRIRYFTLTKINLVNSKLIFFDQQLPYFQCWYPQTCRPTCLDITSDQHKTIADISENMNPWNIFLEMLAPDSGFSTLPNFDKENDVALFFKFYDPKQKRIHYCGHHYLPIASKPADLIPILNKRAG